MDAILAFGCNNAGKKKSRAQSYAADCDASSFREMLDQKVRWRVRAAPKNLGAILLRADPPLSFAAERCWSGRTGLPAKQLHPKRVSGVRIPPSPPDFGFLIGARLPLNLQKKQIGLEILAAAYSRSHPRAARFAPRPIGREVRKRSSPAHIHIQATATSSPVRPSPRLPQRPRFLSCVQASKWSSRFHGFRYCSPCPKQKSDP